MSYSPSYPPAESYLNAHESPLPIRVRIRPRPMVAALGLPLRNGFPFAGGGAFVEAAGAHDAVVVELFDDVGGPADDAGDDEEGRVDVFGEAEVVVEAGAGPIDVGRDAFFLPNDGFDRVGHAFHVLVAGFGGDLGGEFFEVDGTGIAVFVNAVAEAHDFFLLGQGVADPGFGTVRCADFVENIHRGFVGAAVERAFEGADGGGDAGMQVGEGRYDTAGGESAGVEFVLGVEDERDI